MYAASSRIEYGTSHSSAWVGTLCCWDQVSRNAANEAFSRYGAVIRWREDGSGTRAPFRNTQVRYSLSSRIQV